jgi:carboxyl-terminal processing protease
MPRMNWIVPGVILATSSCSLPFGQPAAPAATTSAIEPTIGQIVASLMGHEHLTQHPVDDDISRKWLSHYLDDLDPTHSIFLASDVKEFQTYATKLDDLINDPRPSVDPAFAIETRYEQRFHERLNAAHQALLAPVTFGPKDTLEVDRSKMPWPATAEEADLIWKKRIADALIRAQLSGKDTKERIDSLDKSYKQMERTLDGTEPLDVLERYLGALTRSFDPHSDYFKPATRDNFDIEIANALEGIGAELKTVEEYTVVSKLVPGGPAEMGGQLKPGDKIVAVGQGKNDLVDVVGMRLDSVVKLIRGAKGTDVRLSLIGADDQSREITITRDRVLLPESMAKGEMHTVPVSGRSGAPKDVKVLVVDVPSFYASDLVQGSNLKTSVTDDVKKILQAHKDADAVVLDLRTNGGGSLQESIALTGLFIDRGPVVQVKDRRGDVDVLDDEDSGEAYKGPLAVLVSPLSASASEIFAGAIQDYGRGLIIGSTTHGKGTVQTVVELQPRVERLLHTPHSDDDYSGVLKLTTQQFYRISGDSTQVHGVESDVVIPSPFDAIEEIRESELDGALPWNRIDAATYERDRSLTMNIPWLQQRSHDRVVASKGFQDMAKEASVQKSEQAKKTLSLDLDTRKKERADLEAMLGRKLDAEDDDDEDAGSGSGSGAKPEEKPDPVMDEALAVMADDVVGPDGLAGQ